MNRVLARLFVHGLILLTLGSALTFSACTKQPGFSVRGPHRSSEPHVIANRLSRQYGNKTYISFKSHVENHESIGPNWTVKPGRSIAPGTHFDVVMSDKGDVRTRLYVENRIVYESRAAVLADEPNKGKPSAFSIQEFDYRNRVRTAPSSWEKISAGTKLADEALDHASWCASGGYTHTLVGTRGRGADLTSDDSFAYQIAHGRIDREEVLADGRRATVVRFVQQEAADPGKSPQGQDLPARPKIWWDIYVDAASDLIIQKDGYFEKPGEKPVLVRRARYTDIEFPTYVDEEAVFRTIPEAAQSYRIWNPDEPYPGTRLNSGT